MGPFGVCTIVYSLQFKGPKGAQNFDQPPLPGEPDGERKRQTFALARRKMAYAAILKQINPRKLEFMVRLTAR